MMTENEHTLHLVNEFDIISARVYAREMARREGFSITDQARISLAVSSLAHKLGLGQNNPAEIELTCIRRGARMGMRITIRVDATNDLGPIISNLEHMRWMFMVDELTTERSVGLIKIVAVKWAECPV
jgi:hypothetical protein